MSNENVPTVSCQKCGRCYRWRPEFAGHKIVCLCGQQFVLPKSIDEIVPVLAHDSAAAANPPVDLSLNQIQDLLQEDLLVDADEAAELPPPSQADLDSAPHLCPNCKAYWAAGGTFCLRCGYVLETKVSEAAGDVGHLRDHRIRAQLVGGVTALVSGLIWAGINYSLRDLVPLKYRLPPWMRPYNFTGVLALVSALLICHLMSREQKGWPRLLQAASLIYTVLAILIGNAGGHYGWLDLLWIPLALYYTYDCGAKAYAIERHLIFT